MMESLLSDEMFGWILEFSVEIFKSSAEYSSTHVSLLFRCGGSRWHSLP